MKHYYIKHILTLALLCLTASAGAQVQDSLFVKLNNGELYVFPSLLTSNIANENNQLVVTTKDGTVYRYANSDIAYKGMQNTAELPVLTSFKLNNKYNDQVFTDVIGEITTDNRIKMQVGAIGRWLTPSFNVEPITAKVYVNGEEQMSKETRLNFANPVTYTVANDGCYVFSERLVTPAVIKENPEYTSTKVALTGDMITTNAPSNKGEDPANMLDGNTSTFFHSTWGDGPYAKLPLEEHPYLDFALPEALHHITFSYSNRYDTGGRHMTDLLVLASKDGINWTEVAEYTTSDGLPTEIGGTFSSPVIDLKDDYGYLRFEMVAGAYKNYMCISEFSIYKIEYNEEDNIISPAVYSYEMMPYGTNYDVELDWLADKATRVPRIDLDIEGGNMISSKDYYLNADIKIDGAGVYPSMTGTVQVKGRGNTSWSSYPWDKNPYRLKFAEKVKPFGMTKGKNWVLLANKQSNSMMANAVGMKIACAVETAAPNHIVPVDLYINGQYRGSYNFTEKVGISNNSIELEDETAAALLELDTYYDETYKFRSSAYYLPVNIKDPDFTDPTVTITLADIQTDVQRFLQALSQKKDIDEMVDIDYLARYLMVNEFIMNYEIMHPKSTFLYKEFIGDTNDKFIFGPVWDLDWAFGYETNKTYFESDPRANFWTSVNMESSQFIRDLRQLYESVDKAYYRVWRDFMRDHLQEVLDFCDDYYAYARPSFEQNATMWGDGKNYASTALHAKIWLNARAQYIFSGLKVYDLDEDPVPSGIENVEEQREETLDLKRATVDVYDLRGVCVKRNTSVVDMRDGLAPGIYIVNGKKIIVK